MLGGEMATDFFAGGGIKLKRAVVPIAANCSKNPEVTNAAAGTFLHEGREAAVRCGLHGGPHCGQSAILLPLRQGPQWHTVRPIVSQAYQRLECKQMLLAAQSIARIGSDF